MVAYLPLIFTFAGLLVLWFAVSLIRSDLRQAKLPKISVEGEVIGHAARPDRKGTMLYASVYRFVAPEGESREVADSISRNFALEEVGTRRALVYPVGQPEAAGPPRKLGNMVMSVFLILFGLVFVVVGLVIFVMIPQA